MVEPELQEAAVASQESEQIIRMKSEKEGSEGSRGEKGWMGTRSVRLVFTWLDFSFLYRLRPHLLPIKS